MAYDGVNQRIIIAEAYEGAPAFAAGIDRGTAIVGIGPNSVNVRTAASIVAARGNQGPTDAPGATDPGVSRVPRITEAAGPHHVTLAQAASALSTVSTRAAPTASHAGRLT